jgi:hypothetical protein
MDRTPSTQMIRAAMGIEKDDLRRAAELAKAWRLREASVLSQMWAREDLNAVGYYRID